jgi:TolB-like protein/Tfp pilus assembly protein PilF
MKRCPECRRDYYDDTLLYCLDDGNALLEGPASMDEPATAILYSTAAPGEAPTRAQIQMTDKTAILPSGIADVPKASSFDRRLLFAPIALAVIVLGGFFAYRYYKPASTEQINSIAVLPFENRSGNADTDYLSDGLADSLIFRLSQLPNLKVSPTSSVMRYKGKETDVAQIAKELEVDAVMSGRLSQRGDDLSISVQLIDSRTKKLIWAEQYDRKMADLLATQREIATTITQKLQLKLAGTETQGITRKYTDNNEAYQFYLKGKYHYAKRTKEEILKGIEDFEQAIALDPNFALAYVEISDSYSTMPAYPYVSPKEAFPKAKAAAEKALAIDPTLAEAHSALGFSLAVYDWNWAEAKREFEKAIELNPNLSFAHFRYGWNYLLPVGSTKEAIKELKHSLELERMSLVANAILAIVYADDRQNEQALNQARKIYDLDPNFPTGRWALSQAFIVNGMYAETIELNEKSLQNAPTNQLFLRFAGYANAKSNRRKEAESIINKFEELSKTEYVMSYRVANIYAALGEKDKAFAELEKAFENHDWELFRLKVDPLMDPLRDDPRFKAMLKRMGLPE